MSDEVALAFRNPPETYGTGDDFHARHARSLVAVAGLRPGVRVLDVATGSAPAAIAAARIVGSTGHVIGIDISQDMLALADRIIPLHLRSRIELLAGDGAALPLPDAHVDAVICASSLAWFPDIPATLREWARVTRPGGRLAFSCLAESALPIGRMLRTHLNGYGISFPDLNAPLNTPQRCRQMMIQAGYIPDRVRVQRHDGFLADGSTAWHAAGGSCMVADPGGHEWHHLQASPVALWSRVRRQAPIPLPLSDAELAQVERDFLEEVDALRTDEGIANPMMMMLVTGRRSA